MLCCGGMDAREISRLGKFTKNRAIGTDFRGNRNFPVLRNIDKMDGDALLLHAARIPSKFSRKSDAR